MNTQISIDVSRCVGGGQCVVAAPEVFDQSDEDGTVILLSEHVGVDQLETVRDAARLCPAAVITVSQEAGR